MKRNLFGLQTVKEVASDVLQQYSSSRHQVWYTTFKLVYMIEWTAANIHKFRLALFCIRPVNNSTYTMLGCCYKLNIILVRKSITKVRHTINTVLNQRTVSIKEYGRLAQST